MAERPAEANVADLLRDAAARYADRPALIGDGLLRSWADLDAAVDAGADELAQAGLSTGARVIVALPSGPDLIVALFAVARAGLVAVPIDPARTDLAVIAGRVQADAGIALSRDHGRVTAFTPADLGRWWSAPPGSFGQTRGGGEGLAMVARASHSDRAVMLSHRAVLAAVHAIAAAPGLSLRDSDRVLLVLPLHHPSGFVTAFLPLTTAGASGVLPSAADAASALAAVRAHRVSIIPAAPGLFHEFTHEPGADRSLASVRLMTSGAAPLDPTDFAAIRRLTGQPVWEGYGVSESSSVISTALMTKVARPGSVGLPLAGIAVRIGGVDEDDDDAAADDELAAVLADDGEVGQIEISGPTLFSGYWPDGAGGPDTDGWFGTGDFGYLDDQGELHLVDRASETLTVAGFTVYPREVEEVLADHPYVAEAAVVGVPGPAGEDVVAILVARPGTRPTQSDLDEFVASRLPAFKRPVHYRVVDALPRKELGRIDRAAARESFATAEGIDLTASAAALTAVSAAHSEGEPTPEPTDEATTGPQEDPDVAPEPVADLADLGNRLLGHDRGGRGVEDTDEDLFGDEVG
jgi:long-chain acyl-CoA synthetase